MVRQILPQFAVFAALAGASVARADLLRVEPSASVYGTMGLGQIVSAEAMGAGRLTLQVRGNLYQQANEFAGVPAEGALVTTFTGAAAFGISQFADVFVGLGAFNISGSADSLQPLGLGNGGGLGTVHGGVQASLPFSEKIPARVGAQLVILAGTAKSQINTNNADGYNYFETRKGTDIMGRLMQSIVFQGDVMSLKLHLNEGMVTSLQKDRDALLIQGVGLAFAPHPTFVLGMEFQSRTNFKDSRDSDPIWFSPSLVFRNQAHIVAQVGGDMSLSQERTSADRALEPWRLYGSLTFSMNVFKPSDDREKARRDSLERLALSEQARRAQAMADSLARKAREDSLAAASQRDRDRLVADSLARKAREDSLALADARRRLEEERNKMPAWERDFLRTGVLNLEALYFETGKAVISINSKPYLNIVAKVLGKYPKLQMEIGGHTDNTGSMSTNTRLSQDRSDAVRMYLSGVVPDLYNRLSARGYGPNMPKATNASADGRQINRRVEITVLNKDVLREYE